MLIVEYAYVPIVCRVKFYGQKARTKSANNSWVALELMRKNWAKIVSNFSLDTFKAIVRIGRGKGC